MVGYWHQGTSTKKPYNYVRSESISIFYYRTKWRSEPYILGSYAAIPCGFDYGSFEEMLRPITYESVPKVYFAGEAYHKYFYSTIHAAYQTAVDQANEISIRIKPKERVDPFENIWSLFSMDLGRYSFEEPSM